VTGLTFITLLAFDYRYALSALPSYYDIADQIVLGIDRDRISWSHHPFTLNMMDVHNFLRQLDLHHKIRIVEGDFHSLEEPMANDTAERNYLSLQCDPSHWIVQIDADEILTNPAEFRLWLLTADPSALVGARWVTVFKTFDRVQLIIDPPAEITPVATRLQGQYVNARWTRQKGLLSPLGLYHYSWGRTPDEGQQKLLHWSHSRDFDVAAFYQQWLSVTPDNYQHLKDFHPMSGPLWPSLKLVELNR